jgi:DNA polymerase I-like protein with 3'-5' exonuclease and polymerase domains
MDLKFDPDKPNFEYITETAKAEKALQDLSQSKILAVDIESNSLDPYTGTMFLIQIAKEDKSYVFDARRVKLKELPLFKSLMEDPKRIKILQNAKFDYSHIKIRTGVVLNNMYDTMLAEGVLTAGYNESLKLDDIISRRTGQEMIREKKKLQRSFVKLPRNARISQDQLKYAALDTLSLFPVMEEQIKLLHQEKLLKIAKLEFAVAPVVAGMELKGVYINTKRWREIINDIKVRRNELAEQFQEAVRPYYNTSQIGLFGGMADAININSSVQLMDLFNNKLGLSIPSTSDGVLSREKHPLVKILRDYRSYEKLISTYGEKLLRKINRKTGRIHPEFLQIRTATGRFACNNPNLQNIPRNSEEAPFRECFNPAEGYKLVVSDYSSFEMRILAELSRDDKMIRALNEGLDIHSYTASLMFDKPYTDNFKKEYPELRQMAKPIGFGLMYGMGAMGLVSQVYAWTGRDITVEEGEDLIRRYFASYPGVKDFLDRSAKDAVRKGWSTTPAGRKRWYRMPDKLDPDYNRKISAIKREAKNHPIQGTNADAIKYALVFVQDRIDKENIDGAIVSTVHDEIVCEVREDQAEDFAKVLSDEMVRAGELFLKKVKIKSDPFVGDVWEH